MNQNITISHSSSKSLSTVADPSTVTLRIETNDLNVQDVLTASSSSSDNDDKNDTNCLNNLVRNKRQATSAIGLNMNSSGMTQTRPLTAISLPSKSSTYENQWNIESIENSPSSDQQNQISPTNRLFKAHSQSLYRTCQQVPSVFITATAKSEYFEKDFHSSTAEDLKKHSQLLPINKMLPLSTSQLVFLTDHVLLGSIRALQNEKQLCKLSVDYLIDATNMRADELARKTNVGARLPCNCGHAHSRCTLTIDFDQTYLSRAIDCNNLNQSRLRELNRFEFDQLFSVVNRFISKAQQKHKLVLIYGYELTINSPLAVVAIQYLMLNHEQLSLDDAKGRLMHLFPKLPVEHQKYPNMEKRFQDYLKQLERRLRSKYIYSQIKIENRQPVRDMSWELYDKASTSESTSWTTVPMPIVNHKSNSSPHLPTTRSAWDI